MLKSIFATLLAVVSPAASAQIRHVILISVDGMHAKDLDRYIAAHPQSNLAELSEGGTVFTNARTTLPSDSLPSMVGIVTGAEPAVSGIYYDDAYNRALSPPGSGCKTRGTVIDLKESIDREPENVNAIGIDESRLPLDPNHGCRPVYPHQLLRVPTVFELLREKGFHTAYSEKRPAYDILSGPSGRGVADLYVPEIAAGDTLKSLDKTIVFDELRVDSVLQEIAGRTHDGARKAPVPALFGMNFQCINSAKKTSALSGYADAEGSPDPGLARALDYVDAAIGRMRAEVKGHGLDDQTAWIITAKHGETPFGKGRKIVLNTTVPELVNSVHPGLAAKITAKTSVLIWLNDRTKTQAVFDVLRADQARIGGGQTLAFDKLRELFPVSADDPTVPDIVVIPDEGTNYEPTLDSKTRAEHGGMLSTDTHVPLLVSLPGAKGSRHEAAVKTTQIAPTILGWFNIKPLPHMAPSLF